MLRRGLQRSLRREFSYRLFTTITINARSITVRPFVTESDDVAAFVACEVCNESRVLSDLPSLCGSEVIDDEVNWSKTTTAVIQRRRTSPISITNYVRPSIAHQVSYEARVNANLPITVPKAEIVDDGLGWCNSLIAIVATDVDMVLAETDDIDQSVSCNIGKETKMTFETPTSIVTEVVQSKGRGAEV
jgi:hypothetical protein